jgi:hypothetical protein
MEQTTHATNILEFIKLSRVVIGMPIMCVFRKFGPTLGNEVVQRAIDWLASEGHTYTTCDEQHVRWIGHLNADYDEDHPSTTKK